MGLGFLPIFAFVIGFLGVGDKFIELSFVPPSPNALPRPVGYDIQEDATAIVA